MVMGSNTPANWEKLCWGKILHLGQNCRTIEPIPRIIVLLEVGFSTTRIPTEKKVHLLLSWFSGCIKTHFQHIDVTFWKPIPLWFTNWLFSTLRYALTALNNEAPGVDKISIHTSLLLVAASSFVVERRFLWKRLHHGVPPFSLLTSFALGCLRGLGTSP